MHLLKNTMTNIRSFWKEEMKLNSENMWQFRLRSNLDLKDSLKQTIIRQLLHTSEILDHLQQLPGLAMQRLMEKGYGFGAEGDWKTAAMVRVMKIMTQGKKDAKGTSFMEDYTYNLVPGKEGILEAHMLEVCPTIADGPISIKCQPLSMGDREDPARLVFTAKEGPAVATSLVDLGDQIPPDHQQCRLQEDRKTDAEASGCNCILDTTARPQNRCRSMDPGRWSSSYSILL